jgi:predicted  nucleic acid-binding Zn-ribbon protein
MSNTAQLENGGYFSDSSDANTIVVENASTASNALNAENEKVDVETLKRDYENLLVEFNKMKLEYSENTIIQSMNDMKDRYNELVNNTVSLYKYKTLETKYNNLYKGCYSSLAILSHIKKLLGKIEKRYIYDPTKSIDRANNDLDTILEILEDSMTETFP